MNKKWCKPKLYNGLFFGFSIAFVVFLSGRGIAMANSGAVNDALHITTSRSNTNKDAVYFKRTYTTDADVKKYVSSVAQEAEGEGLVLLKNDNNSLPLAKGTKIALFGTASYRINYNTSGSSSTDSSNYKSLSDSLKDEGFNVDEDIANLYASDAFKTYGRTFTSGRYLINEAPYSLVESTAKSSLKASETAIVTLARESGEGKDISTVRSDGLDGSYLSLSQEETDLLKGLTALKKNGSLKNIIVLLNSSNPISTAFLSEEGIDVDSCLWIGNVGAYGLSAVCDVLSGDINPSGRLSDTYVKDNFSSPAMSVWMSNPNSSFARAYSNYKAAGLNSTNRAYATYEEGIYVGYHYYETRYEDAVLGNGQADDYSYSKDVAYPFGYGLSYTTFETTGFRVTPSKDGKEFDVSVKVKNTGNKAGKHAVEIYLQKPYTDYDKQHGIEKASVELAGYAKTSLLAPDQEEEVKIPVKKSQLKTYDADGKKTYILEKGDYYITFGEDAHNAVNNILEKKGASSSKIVGNKGDSSLAYQYSVREDDFTTYAKSEATGESITNQLDHADMNRYEGKGTNSITYVSRNKWKDTWPKERTSFAVGDKMKEDLGSHKALPSDGTMPTYNSGKHISLIDLRTLSFADKKWDELLDSMSKEDQIRLVTDGQLVTAALSSINLPGTVEKDGPTAVTTTKTDSSFPSEGIWASTFNNELIEKIGDAFAEDIVNSDVQGIYAPGVNLHRTPFGGRSNEYFSEDPYLTGKAASVEIQGLQKKGVVAHIKHFAFNNEETNRNGISIWLNEQSARELYLLPFEMAVQEGDTGALMNSFNRAGCLWTGGDKNLSINILQKEFGFKGYAITDMGAANGGTYMVYDDAYMGGTNLFMASPNTLDDYKNNAAFCEKVRDSAHRILYTIVNKSVAMNGFTSDTQVVTHTPWWEVLLNTLVITFGCLAGVSLALDIVSEVLLRKDDTI